MKRAPFLVYCGVMVVLLVAVTAAADVALAGQREPEAQQAEPGTGYVLPESPSVTSHEIMVDGSSLAYTATAGFMPIYDDSGTEKAEIFYVAYEAEGEKKEKRPVTFAFNGGPGAAALWVHLGAFGPRIVSMDASGLEIPKPPFTLRDNGNTLLDQTDLVFVDPVGTGFSRAASEDEAAEEFWGVQADITSVGEFIRMYLNRRDRWNAPVYIAGESYGGLRAPGLAAFLQDMGVMPSGIILISPAPSYGDLDGDTTNERPYVHLAPAMAAAAHYHGKSGAGLPADRETLLEEARRWAKEDYLQGLWKGYDLRGDDREQLVREMAGYTGLPGAYLQAEDLRVSAYAFAGRLLREERRFLSLYDSRLTAYGSRYDFSEDPLMFMTGAPYITLFREYLEEDLGLEIDRRYIPLSEEANARWNFHSGALYRQYGYPNVVGQMAKAMRRDPHMDLFVAMGLYDMVCPRESVLYSLRHMEIPPERIGDITFETYLAGHMLYTRASEHQKLKDDLTRFYDGR
ncbi:MAG: septum formation initiator [Synergistales bacterium]|nr:septum formation initiator [Synergistales bacterium]